MSRKAKHAANLGRRISKAQPKSLGSCWNVKGCVLGALADEAVYSTQESTVRYCTRCCGTPVILTVTCLALRSFPRLLAAFAFFTEPQRVPVLYESYLHRQNQGVDKK